MNTELENLTLIQLLDQMAPIVVPDPVSYTPQTPAWVILAMAILFAVLVLLWRQWLNWQSDAYRRTALSYLAQLKNNQSVGDQKFLSEVSNLLRRSALASFPRSDVASLHGDDWLDFLDRTGSKTVFTRGIGRYLATGPYRRDIHLTKEERSDILSLVRTWIGMHRERRTDD